MLILEFIRLLNQGNDLLWLCMSDFNEIISHDEKHRGSIRPKSQMKGFREALMACNFLEILFRGSKFTWMKGSGDNTLLKRLDRGLAIASWLNLFPKVVENHLVTSYSDYCPFLFDLMGPRMFLPKTGNHFKFENFWVKKEGCHEAVINEWGEPGVSTFGELSRQIKQCEVMLNMWNKNIVGNIGVRIKGVEMALDLLMKDDDIGSKIDEISQCKKVLAELMNDEEMKQHAKTN
ncbi:hypothetical protein PTKIN_Ptkin12aG0001700 [Pterospermum kingtungense]